MNANPDLEHIIAGLASIPPDEAFQKAQAFVARMASGDLRFNAAALPDEVADIELTRHLLWKHYDQHRYNYALQGLAQLPPVAAPSVPGNF